MNRTTIVALCWIPLLACGAPRSIRNASQAQIEALQETQVGVVGYLDLTEQILDKTEAARRFGKEVLTVTEAVDKVLEEGIADPIEASDEVASELFALRRAARAEEAADQFRAQHREDLRHLILLLQLLERSQRLIHEYVSTDVGPTAEQISELGAEFRKLQAATGAGNP